MAEKKDELKGRVEEAAGVLADDSTLKREGQIDRAGARIKDILEDAKTKVDDAVERLNVDSARDRTKEILDEAKTKVDQAVDALKARLRDER